MLSPISISIASSSTKLLFPIPKSSFNGLRIQHRLPAHLPISVAPRKASSSSSVVMMAKRDEELKEIRAKTTEQLNEEIIDLKGDLLMLRLQKSARNEFKANEFRRMRKKVSLSLYIYVKIICFTLSIGLLCLIVLGEIRFYEVRFGFGVVVCFSGKLN